VRALREKIAKLKEQIGVSLFVMADSTYGSCCVDEVGASRINADCVIHYGHTCLSPWVLLFIFISYISACLFFFFFFLCFVCLILAGHRPFRLSLFLEKLWLMYQVVLQVYRIMPQITASPFWYDIMLQCTNFFKRSTWQCGTTLSWFEQCSCSWTYDEHVGWFIICLLVHHSLENLSGFSVAVKFKIVMIKLSWCFKFLFACKFLHPQWRRLIESCW
jgi:hypothetical protein